jgi:apolipoprotein N-acyltransferase
VLPPQADFAAGDRFAVVLQPNLDEQEFYTGAEQVHQLSARLAFLTMHGVLEAGSEKPALMIWSEMPAPFYYEEDPILRQQVGSLARVTRAPLLFNMVGHARDGAPLNSALALSAQGEPLARYDKIHLVPFGEYVPWPFGLIVQKFTSEIGDFQAGSRLVLWPLEGRRAASFICYESAFPSLARQFSQAGAEVLFNLSNDGYFGRSISARGQHLLLVRMRAAENARWIVRATNDGFTASVDPAGRVVDRVPAFQQSVSRMQFSFRRQRTLYTRWGDWFAWSCVALSGLALAPAARGLFSRKKRDSRAEAPPGSW